MNLQQIKISKQAWPWVFAGLVGVLFFFSNPQPQYFYDYTFRIALALLHGKLGLTAQPPSWLNEMVYFRGNYYSVFPLGSVLSMVPFGFLKVIGWTVHFPARLVVAVIAAATFLYAYFLSFMRRLHFWKRITCAFVPLVCTWAWTNLAFGGAWQVALGFALLGELAALYYVLVRKQYLVAGLWFAVAFGNRTEILITTPLVLYLIATRDARASFGAIVRSWSKFLAIPFLLLVCTAVYNYARFSSVFDFGYARIPGVLSEPWYRHGIFSLYAIPLNAYTMLLQGWNFVTKVPYFLPNGFGGSILIASPWLFLLFRDGKAHNKLIYVSWLAIFALTFTLWIHGDPGGWQFSYRYGMVFIPWCYLILLLNSPEYLTINEIILIVLSFIINAYATYLYYWTTLIHP